MEAVLISSISDFVQLDFAWWLAWGLIGLAILAWVLGSSQETLESNDKKTLAMVLAVVLVMVVVCHRYIVIQEPDPDESGTPRSAQPAPAVPEDSA